MKRILAITLLIGFFATRIDGKELLLDESSIGDAPFRLEAKRSLHPSGDFTVYELKFLIKKGDEYKYHVELFQFEKETKRQHSAAVWVESTDMAGQRFVNVKFHIGKTNTETIQIVLWRNHSRHCFESSTYRLNLDSPLIVARKWN